MAGRRRSRSRIHTSDDDDGATRPSRRRRRAEVAVPLPDGGDTLSESLQDDSRPPPAPSESLPLPLDMLWKILLLLPPQPSSRLRASAVSRRWRGVATDPNFKSQFRVHRRNCKPPPILGLFVRRWKMEFRQGFLHPSDRVPAERFSIPSRYDIRGCRHGRVLAVHREYAKLLVFAPLSGEVCTLSVPDEFRPPSCFHLNGAVLCDANDHGHVHGMCHQSPFKVVLLSRYSMEDRFITSVYSSRSKKWSVVVSKEAPCSVDSDVPAILVNNRLYWLLSSKARGLLEFDLDRQSLTVIEWPTSMIDSGSHGMIKTEEGAVGLVRFSFPSLEIWQRKINQGVATWLDPRIVDMHNVLGIPPQIGRRRWPCSLRGYEEENHVIILYVDDSAYMVDLKSMQSTKLDGSRSMNRCHPFTSFYPPDMAI
ncbi:hypothetical protein CFC21_038947 [Triticum aestivum]|uniref:F-box domain-containing protein n=2 Tax=Triticum aestivum TaxID=4565 RepID=A0A3B6U9Y3_WHEAT|nr:uncharacterized protein LOC119274317 [Triticum dicoccoides]XP_044445289.1 uncharacterized protein LOC123172354 [Triticum aestivum]KAF7026861.1 hypothetical protein CFC21_038947 [Triticum aestivum]